MSKVENINYCENDGCKRKLNQDRIFPPKKKHFVEYIDFQKTTIVYMIIKKIITRK